MIHCSAQRERCMEIMQQANRKSHAESREAVRSMLLAGALLKFSSAAVSLASIGSDVPAMAPLPKGDLFRTVAWTVRIVSNSNISAQARASAAAQIGCAR